MHNNILIDTVHKLTCLIISYNLFKYLYVHAFYMVAIILFHSIFSYVITIAINSLKQNCNYICKRDMMIHYIQYLKLCTIVSSYIRTYILYTDKNIHLGMYVAM